jgi:hypothetical protein
MKDRQFSSTETRDESNFKAVLEQRKQFVDVMKYLSYNCTLNTKLIHLNGIRNVFGSRSFVKTATTNSQGPMQGQWVKRSYGIQLLATGWTTERSGFESR